MAKILQSLGFDLHVFLFQIVLFIAFLVVMNAIFWKPMLAHLAKRDQTIRDAYGRRDELRGDMEKLRAEYLARIAEVEADARSRIQTAIKEAQSEREQILAAARTSAEQMLRQGIADVAREQAEAIEALKERIIGLSAVAVGKALGPSADAAAVRRTIENQITAAAAPGNPARN